MFIPSGDSKSAKQIFVFTVLTIMSLRLFGQALSVNNSQLNFGIVDELNPVSRSLTITNLLNRTVTVSGIGFYDTYESPAFSTPFTYFTIAPGDSVSIDVWFSPRHNIYHNSEMVIYNDGLRGSLSIDLQGQGTYSKTYYASSQNKSEEALKNSLNVITSTGYVSLLYGPARDEMFMVIDNQRVNGQGALQNTLESVYTGDLAIGYTSRTDAQTNYSFNTEHTFPQSLFTSQEPMRSDLHHLFPTDNLSNNTRGDDPFGVVSNPSWTSGGSKSNGTLFEPRDEQKGRAARSMFYFVLRYQNYSNFLNSQESILRSWHEIFPPDQVERRRNDDIFSFQNNRNPFVDYPQLVKRIHSLSSFSAEPASPSLDIIQDTLIYGTVAQSSAADFRFVLVNDGNVPVSLSQFTLSHSGVLSFSGAANDTSLLPGESLQLTIRYFSATGDSVRGWLSFQTDVPGLFFVNIPVFVNDLTFTAITEINSTSVSVHPNPAQSSLFLTCPFVSSPGSVISVYSVNGVLVRTFEVNEPFYEKPIDISSLSPGVYFISLENAGLRSEYVRFLKIP
jgi:hypothetical protein